MERRSIGSHFVQNTGTRLREIAERLGVVKDAENVTKRMHDIA
jgi:hypothetical protein